MITVMNEQLADLVTIICGQLIASLWALVAGIG